jgi:hypothetical protein
MFSRSLELFVLVCATWSTLIAAQFLPAPKVVRVEAVGSEPNSQGNHFEFRQLTMQLTRLSAVLEMGGYSKDNQYFGNLCTTAPSVVVSLVVQTRVL